MFLFARGRAKKIQNKAVVNTSTLMRESEAENNKARLSCGNSRMAGKRSQESVPRSRPAARRLGVGWREGLAAGSAWGLVGEHLLGIPGALAQASLWAPFGPGLRETHSILR